MVGVYFMPESPKFLVSIKKYDQARLAINIIARVNKSKEVFDCQFDTEVIQRKENHNILNPSEISMISDANILSSPKALIMEEKKLDGSLKDLLKIRRHLVNLILMIFFWVSSSFSVYLVNYNIKNIKGDFFMNNLVSALTAIPISAIGGFFYYRLGLKMVFMIFFSFSVVGGIAIIIFSENYPD
jgi:Na+/melibiose symporter-like transporter